MKLKKKLNVGVIGLGVGEQHVKGYFLNENCNLKSICDLDSKKLKTISSRYKKLKTTRQANDILKDPEIDIVSIASFDNFHHEQILVALENNKHIFVEKPLCLTRKELNSIIKTYKNKKNLILTSNFILRKTKRFIQLKENIRKGFLGNIYYLEGDYDYGRLHKINKGWRGTLENYSVVHGGAIHLIDLLIWFLEKKVVEVFAYGNKFSTNNLDFQKDDMVTSLLKFENGVVAKISANFPSRTNHHHKVAVYGTKATFLQGHLGACYIKKNEDEEPIIKKLNDSYPGTKKSDLINNFVDTVLDKEVIEVNANDIFEAMNISLSIEESITTGRPVKIK